MSVALDQISWDNPIFKSYVYWTGILAFKMLAMVLLTGFQRFSNMTFANPEDAIIKNAKVKFDDPNVERVRRAHLNDMESIYLFILIGFLYVLTSPPAFTAINLFRIFGIARILHTLVYAVYVVPQPARFLLFGAAYLTTGYMTAQVVTKVS